MNALKSRSRRTKAEGALKQEDPSLTRQKVEASNQVEEGCIVPYDENLLERARTQWQFGEWDSLAKLDSDTLQHHPDRAKLALLAAVAHQQNNDMATAKQFIRLAQNWGCSKKLVSLILIAGVHDTLGRAAASNRQEQKALKHFESAVAMGSPGSDIGLLAKARYDFQTQLTHVFRKDAQFETEKSRLRPKIKNLEKASFVKPIAIDKNKKVIVVAGMRHSGSTALFNIIRLSLEEAGLEFDSWYSEKHPDTLAKVKESAPVCLIKTHELRDDVAEIASVVFTTTRDLRDTVASATRREWPMIAKVGGPAEYAKYNRILHDSWLPLSDYQFIYEEFMANPMDCIRDILEIIGIPLVNIDRIYQLVTNLPLDDYKNTLLTPSHITDPGHCLSYSDSLDSQTIKLIETQNFQWLARYGYLASDSRD